jgi:hypothetical protein
MQPCCDIEFCRTCDIQFGRTRLLPEPGCKRLNSGGRQGCPWRPRLKLDYHTHLHPCDKTACRDCDKTGCRERQNECRSCDKTQCRAHWVTAWIEACINATTPPANRETGHMIMSSASGSSLLVSLSTEYDASSS